MHKILIIEDEVAAARRLQKMISGIIKGVQIIDVLDSIEASVRWLKKHEQPELVFMDIHLADGDCDVEAGRAGVIGGHRDGLRQLDLRHRRRGHDCGCSQYHCRKLDDRPDHCISSHGPLFSSAQPRWVDGEELCSVQIAAGPMTPGPGPADSPVLEGYSI